AAEWRQACRALRAGWGHVPGACAGRVGLREGNKLGRRRRCARPILKLVVDRSEPQIVLEIFEPRLDLGELDIELPQLLGRSASTGLASEGPCGEWQCGGQNALKSFI